MLEYCKELNTCMTNLTNQSYIILGKQGILVKLYTLKEYDDDIDAE